MYFKQRNLNKKKLKRDNKLHENKLRDTQSF